MASASAARGSAGDSLTRRLASAFVGIPLLLLFIWAGGFWFTSLVALAALLGVVELYRFSGVRSLVVQWTPGLALTLLLVLNGHFQLFGTTPILVVAGLFMFLFSLVRGAESIRPWLLTLAGPLYLGATLAYAVLLRQAPEGALWVTLALLATFACDTSAYFIGRAIGRHRMAPRISPGKTWEGAIAGLVGGVGATLLLGWLFALSLELWEAAALGAGIGIIAQVGDLLESALKRAANTKESGWAVPGHGGLLDRLDSVVFTLVLVYYVSIRGAT
ncbi:MAG: phosphatidate cytidylyltransferase [Chloroflexi bacterium]|nr:phosphatidate cytidylyltransferase [Chloroflexota bacterium]